VKEMAIGRVGVPMTDKTLDLLEEHSPGLKNAVWKIFYPMRDEDPIEISVKPGALSGGVLELEFEGRKVIVREEERVTPARVQGVGAPGAPGTA